MRERIVRQVVELFGKKMLEIFEGSTDKDGSILLMYLGLGLCLGP